MIDMISDFLILVMRNLKKTDVDSEEIKNILHEEKVTYKVYCNISYCIDDYAKNDQYCPKAIFMTNKSTLNDDICVYTSGWKEWFCTNNAYEKLFMK
ncbi:hypothetical protein PIROE2DRAFT_14966 [Piromyces sp. E2]|nr:hypothetical protein PIROE2DRAFT_14966 [Piromyces sp. E2]|eukprot:OUM59489.1 hypothetical protein PIROE2DRAFT_14966 [Piromyces sp. E2]